MRSYKRFTQEELAQVIKLREDGATSGEIATKLGVEPRRIHDLLFRLKRKETIQPTEAPINKVIPAKPEKTLNDFQPRDMIKYLYNLGYRIDNEGLYVITKQRVNLQSVICE